MAYFHSQTRRALCFNNYSLLYCTYITYKSHLAAWLKPTFLWRKVIMTRCVCASDVNFSLTYATRCLIVCYVCYSVSINVMYASRRQGCYLLRSSVASNEAHRGTILHVGAKQW